MDKNKKIRIDKIVTKFGDSGLTNLVTKNVQKSDPIIDCIGSIDESNSAIGNAFFIIYDMPNNIKEIIQEIQNNLFDLSADLICNTTKINTTYIDAIDKHVAEINKILPPLTSFVIPKGKSAPLHLARTIVRRAERSFWVYKHNSNTTNDFPGIYLNRLSDLLFVICRLIHNTNQDQEELWKRIK